MGLFWCDVSNLSPVLELVAVERTVRMRESALQTKNQGVPTFPVTQNALAAARPYADRAVPAQPIQTFRLPCTTPLRSRAAISASV